MNNAASFKAYDIDDYITEVYDQTETQRDDVRLLREEISSLGRIRVLEPFCGNGRILIPLAQDGHEIVGMDKSRPMLESARRRIRRLPDAVRRRITLREADVTKDPWPTGFDLVILGANCFYELATAEEQESCIRLAGRSVLPKGHLFLDNNHMEGALDPSWCDRTVNKKAFPTGTCGDGTQVNGTSQTIWFDAAKRLVRIRRTVEIRRLDGTTTKREWIEQKHPPSTKEMRLWLNRHGFQVENLWGDRKRAPYGEESGRAIFWARRRDKEDG